MRGREKEIWEGGGESNMGILAMQALTPLACACTCMHGINYELASKVQSQHWHSSLARDYSTKPLSHFQCYKLVPQALHHAS